MPARFTVIALVAAYNEEDIIGAVLEHLIEQSISVVLIDNGSTDATVEEARRFLGRGVLNIERHGAENPRFSWEALLERKQALSEELDSNWFMHHDADELRESPWPHLDLHQAIQRVDAMGYNAIDFAPLDFWPTDNSFCKGDDPRAAFPYYEEGRDFDRLRVNCWKKTTSQIDLVSGGGHEVTFAGRKVFPLRFILRHYPIRSQAHGEKKVFEERVPRWDPAERERGWHVQYDGLSEGHVFLRDLDSLSRYDPEALRVNLALRHRGVEELEEALAGREDELEACVQERDALHIDRDVLSARYDSLQADHDALRIDRDSLRDNRDALQADRDALQAYYDALQADRDALKSQLSACTEEARAQQQEAAALRQDLSAVQSELAAVLSSWSWRSTAPPRRILHWLRRI